MRKISSLIFVFLLCINAVPVGAVKPNERAKTALGAAAMTPLILSIEWALLSKIDRGVGFWQTLSDPILWKGGAAAGVVVGVLSYYVMSQYTPQAKYDYAVKVKNNLEKHPLYVCKNKNGFEVRLAIRQYTNGRPGLPSVDATIALYQEHVTLKQALVYLNEAVLDMPGDIPFEEKCAALAKEIGELLSELEEHIARIVCTREWVEDLGEPWPSYSARIGGLFYFGSESISEIVDLVHVKKPHLGISAQEGNGSKRKRIFLSGPFIRCLANWADKSAACTVQEQQKKLHEIKLCEQNQPDACTVQEQQQEWHNIELCKQTQSD